MTAAHAPAATPTTAGLAPPEVRRAADAARAAIDEALAAPTLAELAERADPADLSAAVTRLSVGEPDAAAAVLTDVRARLIESAGAAPEAAAPAPAALERLALLRAARDAAARVPALPVDASVQRLFYEEFALYAAPKPRQLPLLALGTASFRAACALVALRRFPAGQYHWDVSGLSRRMLLDVPPAALPRVLATLAFRMGGRTPVLFPHVNAFRRNPFVWVEAESSRSLHRMARALALQPSVRGLVTRAWLHDPGLGRASPHLAWVNRVFLENGGVVVPNGSADGDPDVRANNAARGQAVARGEYRPRYGLVLWPRAAMLAWAARHPEFAD